MTNFGKLEKVDLHELWSGGTTDFTPWLFEQENLIELGNAIGMELEVQETGREQKAGMFQADILCKDLLTDHFVLIENQLERTDHSHLGQLITFSAGLEAVIIIWIAREFTKEHLEALNWLNNITDESIRFFGIEVEAYKIGDSLPAPNFNIVVKPNGWTKQAKKSRSTHELTDLEILQLEYWQGLKNFMEANNSFVKLLGTPPKSWFDVARDKGRYFLTVTANSRDNSLNIWLNIIGEKAKDDFDRLYEIAYQDSLMEVSQNLMWYKILAKVGCAITLKAYADFMEKNDWPNQFAWFKENLEKFDKFFRVKLKELQNLK
jgi:hypothetical protein